MQTKALIYVYYIHRYMKVECHSACMHTMKETYKIQSCNKRISHKTVNIIGVTTTTTVARLPSKYYLPHSMRSVQEHVKWKILRGENHIKVS